MRYARALALMVLAAALSGCGSSKPQYVGAIPVEIRGAAGSYQLYRGGEPYQVKGAGAVTFLDEFVAAGGNSIRTWSTRDREFLDRAHEMGLTVMICLDIARERHGFDYDDPEAVREQFERAREAVLEYRDHPALLAWAIGNELDFNYENPRVYDAVNDIAKMIKELDPNHPTTTTTAGISQRVMDDIRERAPDLDFISIQVYGALAVLPEMIEEIGITMPIMVTEWGTMGHWETDTTSWEAPLELDSAAKAENYREGYEDKIRALEGTVIGDYMFLWGQKQERTPTWYGVFTEDGAKTEPVDMLQYLWTGSWPEDRSPRFNGMTLNGGTDADSVRLEAGMTYAASAAIESLDGEAVIYEWRLMRESTATEVGGDKEYVPEDLTRLIADNALQEVELTAPEEAGAYRLYIYGRDAGGATAHGNIPFFVEE